MQLDPDIGRMLERARTATGKGVGGAGLRPVAIYFHGGGFVLGDADAYDNQSRQLAQQSGVDILFVDYRRAPEARFPCAVADAQAALGWLRENAGALGLDKGRIALCGDSAGANLAISAALAAGRAGQPVAATVLLYPVTDFRPFTPEGGPDYPSVAAYGDGFFLDTTLMRHFGQLYLRTPQDALDPLASPLLAPDLGLMPPHVVITAGHDPLRDQGHAFHLAAKAAGAASDYICQTGMIHNFMGQGGVSPGAAAAFGEVATELGRRLGAR
ncbi:alpha/beta hydrolase [Gemmobacter serpentinus]|uniref:alpha/beta hydrolase n=1 Tax=Gemmobacter serpentinus TaxID=2652247 RepID=UPI00124EC131|nr:alpha/beta hydrolase [Gemmobacter serpentinus]